jgi:hypothetical protein
VVELLTKFNASVARLPRRLLRLRTVAMLGFSTADWPAPTEILYISQIFIRNDAKCAEDHFRACCSQAWSRVDSRGLLSRTGLRCQGQPRLIGEKGPLS